MKSYNVKSNAKRFARGLVAACKLGELEAIEPVETEEGAREWWPAVRLAGEWPDDAKRSLHVSIGELAIIHGLASDGDGPALEHAHAEAEVGHDVTAMVGRSAKLFGSVSVLPAGSPVPDGMRLVGIHSAEELKSSPLPGPHTPQEGRDYVVRGGVNVPLDKPHPDYTRPVPGKDEPSEPTVVMKAAAVGKTEISAAGLAATLPPPAKSTPEEIAQRRAERRARIDAGEYAAPAPTAKEKRETKGQTILRMASQEGGAAAEDIAAACGWQAHTLRGYIGGTLRKRLKAIGKTIEAVRKSGEPTRYVVTDLPADNATA